MEEQGYIEIRVNNIHQKLSPKDIDINEIKKMISDVETFLYPSRDDKKMRPDISYDIQSGSARHLFYLPVSAVILFNGLTAEIQKRGSLEFLAYEQQEVIDRFQQEAKEKGFSISFSNSLTEKEPSLVITNETDYTKVVPQYYESEFYLYGEIYQEGGKQPNIHITTPKEGNLTVAATKEQIKAGEKKTYKPYGIKVKGKKDLTDGKLRDLTLIDFIAYKPVFDRTLLDKAIDRASENLSKIKDVDDWIDELKAEGV